MYRVDLAALAASAARITRLGEDLATVHLASDNRIADAQSGWVGVSAIALNLVAGEWLRTSRQLLGRLGEHALDLSNDVIRLAAADDDGASRVKSV